MRIKEVDLRSEDSKISAKRSDKRGGCWEI